MLEGWGILSFYHKKTLLDACLLRKNPKSGENLYGRSSPAWKARDGRRRCMDGNISWRKERHAKGGGRKAADSL